MVNFLLVAAEIADKGSRYSCHGQIPRIKNGSFYRSNNQIQEGK